MQAIREIVTRDIFKNFEVPKEFGDEFEMILVPTQDVKIHRSGFLQNTMNGDTNLEEATENELFLAANYNQLIQENDREDQIWSKYL